MVHNATIVMAAARHGLAIDLVRMTTGHPAKGGFCTYEVVPCDGKGWADLMRCKNDLQAAGFMATVATASPEWPGRKEYLAVESVWHEPDPAEAVPNEAKKAYIAHFNGRQVGAIGICYPIQAVCHGKNVAEAIEDLYRRYEHCQDLRFTPAD